MKYCPYCGKLVVQNAPLDEYIEDNKNNKDEPIDPKDNYDNIFHSYELSVSDNTNFNPKQKDASENLEKISDIAENFADDTGNAIDENNKKNNSTSNSGQILKSSAHSTNLEDDSNLQNYIMPKIYNPDNVDEDLLNDNKTDESKSIFEKIKSAPNHIPHNIKKEKQFPSSEEKQDAKKDNTEEDINFVLIQDDKFSNKSNTNNAPLDDLNLKREELASIYATAKKSDNGNQPKMNKNRPPSYKSTKIDRKLRKVIILIVALTLILIIAILSYMHFIHNKPSLTQATTTIEAGAEADALSFVSLENEDDYTVSIKSDSIDYMVPGQYKVIYTITGENNDKTYDEEFLFNVVDTTPPAITISDSITVSKDSDFDIMDNINVADSVDGIIDNASVTVSGTVDTTVSGTYPITLSITDKAGNTATKNVSIIVEDNSDPDAFFNQIDAVWKFTDTPGKILTIRKESSKYMMFVGYEASEGYGGEFTFKTLSSDNSTAVFNWTFIDEEGTQNIDVNVDLGIPNDRKMRIDFGSGWEDLVYYKALS
jgi:hypothetical protein